MSGSLKLGVMLILGVLAVAIAINIIRGLLNLLIPLAVVAGIGLIVYGLVSRSSIGGGKRRYLP